MQQLSLWAYGKAILQHYVHMYTYDGITHVSCQHLSIDFVLGSHHIAHSHDSILIVNPFLKRVYFLPYLKTINKSQIAKDFFNENVHLCDFPSSIVYDRNAKFVWCFWKNIMKIMWNQFDRLTKVMNCILWNLLKSIIADHFAN